MATLTLLARPSTAIGGLQGAVDADVLIGSNFKSHASTALTLNAAATNVLLQVGGSTVLTVAAAGMTAAQPPAMGSNKITGLGTPTAASTDAATAAYAEAQKTGGAGPPFYLNPGQSYAANGYIGIGGDGSSTLVQNVTPWRVPAPGIIRDLSVFAFANAPSTLHVLLYKSTSPTTTPTYSATTLDATVTSGANVGEDTTHSISVNRGDLVVGFCNTAWSANGGQISYRYVPT